MANEQFGVKNVVTKRVRIGRVREVMPRPDAPFLILAENVTGVARRRSLAEAHLDSRCTTEGAEYVDHQVSAAIWGLSGPSGNFQYASIGRRGVGASIIAALLIGAAAAIINFFFKAGQALH